jgi:hypothetical protein
MGLDVNYLHQSKYIENPVFRYAVIILFRMGESIGIYFIDSVKYFPHEMDFRGCNKHSEHP